MSTTDDTTTPAGDGPEATPAPRRRRAASRPAGPPATLPDAAPDTAPEADAVPPAAKAARATKRTRAAKAAPETAPQQPATEAGADGTEAQSEAPTAKRTRARKAPAASPVEVPVFAAPAEDAPAPPKRTRRKKATAAEVSEPAAATTDEGVESAAPPALMFQAPEPVAPVKRSRAKRASAAPAPEHEAAVEQEPGEPTADAEVEPAAELDSSEEAPAAAGTEGGRRRRRRGGRGRRRSGDGTADADAETGGESAAGDQSEAAPAAEAEPEEGEGGSSRRRRRRRRKSEGGADEPGAATTRARESGRRRDEITSVKGSTRLEAKKQRRREGREAGRRRPSILTEAEFLARREAVERVMVVRETPERTQIAVLEDDVLVEHYVNRSSGASMIGNVYLGKVQNVLPSMEAAFVDIGRGRNAVLYAGEVNWDAAGLDGQPRRIESALKSGDSVLVQVTKDPIGHKGARLTSQISLPGRFLVYVPRGEMTGISRKLPDTERTRLKAILRDIVPDDAGVIVRTAAEGASEAELARDVARLREDWELIDRGAETATAPALLHGEPDLAIKVVRDIFNEDFHRLVVSGDTAWSTLEAYVAGVAPDLVDRLQRWTGTDDVFHAFRVDEQLAKALDRKVWLPSGGSLVIDRTEAMTVIDVNTGKFTGSGGNLEETVTRNNLEAAEEIVRQLRLRDIGGIIVIDFIDMVLEDNRDLVLRRLLECLGRDRTKHQVAEVTSLGLVQMTRKRIGQGLLEVFGEPCEQCHGRGTIVHSEPLTAKPSRPEPVPALDAVRSAAASAGAAKVHAAARRALSAAEGADEPQPAGDGAADGETADDATAAGTAPAEEAAAPPVGAPAAVADAPGEVAEPARRARGTRRRATRAAGSPTGRGAEPEEPSLPADVQSGEQQSDAQNEALV